MKLVRMILIGLSLSLLLSSCGEKEVKRRTVGYKGKAKSNPFLAAERFLAKQGKDVSSEYGLAQLDYNTSTLFLPPSSINTVGRAKRILKWIDEGGHLVLMLEGGEMGGNDFSMEPSTLFWQEELSDGVDYMFDELRISYRTQSLSSAGSSSTLDLDDWEAMEEKDRVLLGSGESKINIGAGEMELRYWSEKAMEFKSHYLGNYASKDEHGEDDQHRFVSITHGTGRLSLMADARPLRNRYLAYADHAEFLVALVNLSRPGKVIFSSGEGDGFFTMVWRHFKMAVIGILVVVVFWLWRHLPRFGPEQDIVGGGTREFSEQVRGIGRFLWHHKRDDALLGALRANVNRKLSLQPGIGHEGIFEQLADSTSLPVESIIEAMTREHINEPGVMVRVTKNLQIILKNIHKSTPS
ncbi:hypothetical protein NT6N_06890 [Oceaniferula spumae]|uniref:DUF4350 domain-containing protein n=1 Tax=Oceaniferula spumae TaxID=2979115 RepID=A0AAT9FI38_9BACT